MRKTENERARVRRKSTGTSKKNRRGKRREGGQVGDRLIRRRDDWIGIGKIAGKRRKKTNSRMGRIWASLQTHTMWSPLIFVF